MIMRIAFGTYDPSREAEITRWGEEHFVPSLRKLPGFVSYYGGFDREAGRVVGVTVWETREQADVLRERAMTVIDQLTALGVELEPAQTFAVAVHS
jgi:hypothetical protein